MPKWIWILLAALALSAEPAHAQGLGVEWTPVTLRLPPGCSNLPPSTALYFMDEVRLWNSTASNVQWTSVVRTPDDNPALSITVTPPSGTLNPGETIIVQFTGTADAGVTPGYYKGWGSIHSSATNSPFDFDINLNAWRSGNAKSYPQDYDGRTKLTMSGTSGQSRVSQTFQLVHMTPAEPLPLGIGPRASDAHWLAASPSNMYFAPRYDTYNTSTDITVTADATTLPPGSYTGLVAWTGANFDLAPYGNTNTFVTVYFNVVGGTSDVVRLYDVSPLASMTLSAGETQQFSGTATCVLKSRDQADLRLRLYDTGGRVVATSAPVRVTRAGGTTTTGLTLLPAGGVAVPSNTTALILRAAFTDVADPNIVIKESAGWSYPVNVQDLLQMLVLDSNNEFPSHDQLILAPSLGSALRMFGDLSVWTRYRLQSASSGQCVVRMRLRYLDRAPETLVLERRTVSEGVETTFSTRPMTFSEDTFRRLEAVDFWTTLEAGGSVRLESAPEILALRNIFIRPGSIQPPLGTVLAAGTQPRLECDVEASYPALREAAAVTNRLFVNGYQVGAAGWKQILSDPVLPPARFAAHFQRQVPIGGSCALVLDACLMGARLIDGLGRWDYSVFYSCQESRTGSCPVVSGGGTANVSFARADLAIAANPTARTIAGASKGLDVASLEAGGLLPVSVSPLLSRASLVNAQWTFAETGPLSLLASGGMEPEAAAPGLVGDLTLTLDPADLPDDPEFDPANVHMLGLDSSGAAIESVPCAVGGSSTSLTFTARVSGLSSAYVLWDPGPRLRHTLCLPAFGPGGAVSNRLRMVDLGPYECDVTLASWDAPPREPLTVCASLLPRRPQEQALAAWFAGAGASPLEWIELRSDRRVVAGMEWLDDGLRRDTVALQSRGLATGYLTELIRRDGVESVVHVVNPSAFPATVRILVYDSAGTCIATNTSSVAGKGKWTTSVSGLGVARSAFRGSAELRSTQPVCATVVRESVATLSSLPIQAPLAADRNPRLWLPGFQHGPGSVRTRVTLINPLAAWVSVTATAYNVTGGVIDQPRTFWLGPGLIERGMDDLFGWLPTEVYAGSLSIQGSMTGLIGHVESCDAAGTVCAATLPLARELHAAAAFPWAGQVGGDLVRVALYHANPDYRSDSATGQVSVVSDRGVLVGTAPFILAPGQTLMSTLDQLVPASAGQTGGWFFVESGRPLAMAAWAEAAGMTHVSALPIRPLADTDFRGVGCGLPSGLAGWWRGDGDALDSIGSNHGTLRNGALALGEGRVGACLILDGSDDFVEIPDQPAWTPGAGDFAIELWAQFSRPASSTMGSPGSILVGHDEGSGGAGWQFAHGGGKLFFQVHGSGLGTLYLAAADFLPNLNQWYHLAAVRTAGVVRIYIDGAPVSSEAGGVTVPDAAVPLTLGQGAGAGFHAGLLDEVSVYSRALSPAEIGALFAAGGAGKSANPVPPLIRLRAERQGGDARFHWFTPRDSRLQQTANLGDAWSDTTGAPTVVEGENVQTSAVSGVRQFFRVREE